MACPRPRVLILLLMVVAGRRWMDGERGGSSTPAAEPAVGSRTSFLSGRKAFYILSVVKNVVKERSKDKKNPNGQRKAKASKHKQ